MGVPTAREGQHFCALRISLRYYLWCEWRPEPPSRSSSNQRYHSLRKAFRWSIWPPVLLGELYIKLRAAVRGWGALRFALAFEILAADASPGNEFCSDAPNPRWP